jgi:hypothetical protein
MIDLSRSMDVPLQDNALGTYNEARMVFVSDIINTLPDKERIIKLYGSIPNLVREYIKQLRDIIRDNTTINIIIDTDIFGCGCAGYSNLQILQTLQGIYESDTAKALDDRRIFDWIKQNRTSVQDLVSLVQLDEIDMVHVSDTDGEYILYQGRKIPSNFSSKLSKSAVQELAADSRAMDQVMRPNPSSGRLRKQTDIPRETMAILFRTLFALPDAADERGELATDVHREIDTKNTPADPKTFQTIFRKFSKTGKL